LNPKAKLFYHGECTLKYQLYSHVYKENNRRKYLIENSWNTLYVWTDLKDIITEIQFEYNNNVVVHMSEAKRLVSKISHSSMLNRTFGEEVICPQEMLDEISSLEGKNCLIDDELKKILITGQWQYKKVCF
jgi:hypothetical protein